MPIQNKNLGQYNRPDIFIVETDSSAIELPIQETLINLVPGMSKKGPVNSPIYITTPSQFISIFGDIDKGLERKGSFFHRTCLKMLKTGPIHALNLLLTDDNRDKANFKTISCASNYDNDITKQMPYSRLFNRQDFWERDSETFLEYVNDPQIDYNRLLHLTNIGNKVTTTFMYKSRIEGFDITAEDWYKGKTKVPPFINPKDWISDYMVSVLILDGDWTKYDELTEDKIWGRFFTNTGLNKTLIQDFVDEPNVNVLGFYETSLIPYFKDIQDRDMYIKTVINNDTNKTGLFCAYFEDELLDTDFPIGKIDLIGQNLVTDEVTEDINFLSYKDSISENIEYEIKDLNFENNVFGNYDDLTNSYLNDRNASNTNHFVFDMSITPGATPSQETFSEFAKVGTLIGNTIIINETSTHLTPGMKISFNKDYDVIVAYKDYYIKSVNGLIIEISEILDGPILNFINGTIQDMYISTLKFGYKITSPNAYFNLGTKYSLKSGDTAVIMIDIDTLEFDNSAQTFNRIDVLYLTKENNATIKILKGVQSDEGQNATKPYFTFDYNENIILGYINVQFDNGVLSTYYTPITVDNNGYVSLTLDITSGKTSANYINIVFTNTSGYKDYSNYLQLRYQNKYDELEKMLSDGKGIIINNIDGSKFEITTNNFSSIDYNTNNDASIRIYGFDNPSQYYDINNNGDSDLLFYYVDNEFIAPLNFIYIKSSDNTESNTAIIGKYSKLYQDYYTGLINNGDYLYINNNSGNTVANNKISLNGYFVKDLLTIELSQQIMDFNTNYDNKLIVKSNSSSYKQTVEIEELVYDGVLNTGKIYTIKINKLRYGELIRGEFLEAYYDETKLQYGEVAKKLTRIVKVQNDLENTDLKIITCDSPIKLHEYPSGSKSYNTMTYPSIDVYVSDYKGISLKPFVISQESIPNGTEERQSSILDLISPNTNLGKGLINKNKIQWRYLIDGFGLGLTSNSKQQYSDLLGKKLNSFGFINAPSVKSLKKSVSPSFINDDHTLNTDYLKTGGDEYKNPAFLYSFAEGVGRSTIGYFFPYLRISDEGIPKEVPPAAWVASTYMNKFLTSSSAIQPWTIAAGISNGRVSDIGGVEMDFTDEDLTNLYSMGLNPIVKKKNAGYCINSESTAQVYPYSSLSIIHAREVLIELENALYDMLLRYQWRFNTGAIRAEIKYKADKICQDILDKDGLYDFENIIDETNNTNYIIDLQMGVLDTRVEIIKGMGVIVNNITILKKGDIQSGGFNA